MRRPAVAGQFYDSDPDDLRRSIEDCFLHSLGPGKKPPAPPGSDRILGLVSPHAGYMYSGPVAAHGWYVVSASTPPELVALIGPNHYGVGSGVATVQKGMWMTPLGQIGVDEDASRELVDASQIVDLSPDAHQHEHSIEVQLPFLQYIFGSDFKILPISMALQDRETSAEVGKALAKVVSKKRSLLVASSDLTHYESHQRASTKDGEFIKSILEMDTSKMYNVLQRLNVSACGYGPIAVVMSALKELGVEKATLLKYATSGDVTGDFSAVVGYASIAFASMKRI